MTVYSLLTIMMFSAAYRSFSPLQRVVHHVRSISWH